MSIIKLENVRLSFPDLWEAVQFEGQGPFNYRAALLQPEGQAVLIQQEDKSWKKTTMAEVITSITREAWKTKADAIYKTIQGNPQKCCWYDGSVKACDGYEGNFVLSATRNQAKGRPLVKDRDNSPLTPEDGKPYAGCYVNATVELWAQDNKWGKGLRATLRGVQFVRDGDAFSAGTPLHENEFGTIDAPDTEDDFT